MSWIKHHLAFVLGLYFIAPSSTPGITPFHAYSSACQYTTSLLMTLDCCRARGMPGWTCTAPWYLHTFTLFKQIFFPSHPAILLTGTRREDRDYSLFLRGTNRQWVLDMRTTRGAISIRVPRITIAGTGWRTIAVVVDTIASTGIVTFFIDGEVVITKLLNLDGARLDLRPTVSPPFSLSSYTGATEGNGAGS